MGVPPHDFDIATSALPSETTQIFADCRLILTGMHHGTVTVLMPEDGGDDARMPIEITTFRIDGEYSDSRRPDRVSFTPSVGDDLRRRDFTVNAMAYDPLADGGGALIDLFGGEDDIARGVIRCVGDPDERFGEDALRIMRALRFASSLGFSIDAPTADAARRLAPTLCRISPERIFAETEKLIRGRGAPVIVGSYADVIEAGIPPLERGKIAAAAPVLARAGEADALYPAAEDEAAQSRFLYWCAFLHPSGAGAADGALEELRCDSALRKTAGAVLRARIPCEETREVKTFMRALGTPRAILALKLAYAAGNGSARAVLAEAGRIIEAGECYSTRQLAVTGRDLSAAGIPEGRAVGETLDALLRAVIDGECENEQGALLDRARAMHQPDGRNT